MEAELPFCDYCPYVQDLSDPDNEHRQRASFESHGHIVYACDARFRGNEEDDREMVSQAFKSPLLALISTVGWNS
jgi:hypothetical protein